MGNSEHPVVLDAKEVRRRIARLLEEYNRLAERMSEFENAFVTYVLLPSYSLQLAVKKREFLEREYDRIRENIDWKAYSTTDEVAREVRQALSRAELEYSGRDLPDKDDEIVSRSPVAALDPGDRDFDLTDQEKASVTSEFKRSVIPKVHADTSDAPFEEFNSVLEAYKKKDFLLMKAFIIRYGDEFVREEGEPEEDFVERVVWSTVGDRKVLEALTARIDGLKRNMTAKELESQEEVLRQLKSQNREIQKAIYKEAEEILRVQNLLAALMDTTLIIH